MSTVERRCDAMPPIRPGASHWLMSFVERRRDAFAHVQRAWARLRSLPKIVQLARETQVGTTPHEIVLARGSLRLLRYRRSTPARFAEPILFCYALVNRPYILDLQPAKSVVRKYLEQGFDVYMLDWGTPCDADRHLTMRDYVCSLLRQAVELVLKLSASDRLHLLGYCMGGTFAVLFTTLYPTRVRTLTLLAAPIDFEGKASLLNVWTEREHFDVDGFVDAHGNCPARFLQLTFLLIKPVHNLIEKPLSFYAHMSDENFVVQYFAMERWVNDNIPVAGETFRAFVKNLYQRNELVRNALRVGEHIIDLRNIECPLLLLTAQNDHLVPPRSTEGIRPHVGSRDITSLSIENGHVGLVVSSKAQKTIWPAATSWAASRSTAARDARSSDLQSSSRERGVSLDGNRNT